MMRRRDFFDTRPWGIFMHFLSESYREQPMTPERWNRIVDAFDVTTLARQIARTGAHYLYLTLGQNAGYFCSPNAALDAFCGRDRNTSHCSRRDLIADLAAALEPYRIALLVYLPSHAPAADDEAMKRLACIPPWDFHLWSPARQADLQQHAGNDPRLRSFLRRWESVVEEWAQRWGKQVHGWWFDGCFYREKLYEFADEPNFHSLARAARSGNPDAVFAINPGVFRNPITISDEEDYTSGETDDPELCCCRAPFTGTARYHVLTFAGNNWRTPPLRFDGERMAELSANILNGGGRITWDIPFNRVDGTMTPEVEKLFAAFGNALVAALADGRTADFSVSRAPCRRIGGGEGASGEAEVTIYESDGEVRRLRRELLPEENIFCLREGGLRRSWHYPVRTEQRLLPLDSPENPDLPLFSNGEPIAFIRIGIVGNEVAIRGRVLEKQRDAVVHPDYWRGSCLELFIRTGAGITQRFFPADPEEGAGFSLRQFRYCRDEKFRRTRMDWRDDGYDFTLVFPQPDAKSWKWEFKVTAMRENGTQVALLGNSVHPESDDRFYWTMLPG